MTIQKNTASFLRNSARFYLTFALAKSVPKKDESYEFEDNSIFDLIYDDVQNVIHVNYHTKDTAYDTSGL